jgi:hypothetical protein
MTEEGVPWSMKVVVRRVVTRSSLPTRVEGTVTRLCQQRKWLNRRYSCGTHEPRVKETRLDMSMEISATSNLQLQPTQVRHQASPGVRRTGSMSA